METKSKERTKNECLLLLCSIGREDGGDIKKKKKVYMVTKHLYSDTHIHTHKHLLNHGEIFKIGRESKAKMKYICEI